MKLLILAKSATAVATGRGIPLDSLRHAASRAIPRDGDRIEFRSDRMTDKGPATGTVKTIKPTVDGFYVTVEFADGQATLSWDDMGAKRVKPGLWMVKALDIDAKYRRLLARRLLARRTDGTPEGMAAEGARLRDIVERNTGPAAVEAIRAADAEARAKVREDFGIEYASEGGYAAEVIDFHGLQVVIENPVGSVRAGIDPDGKPWATELTASYGYISGTEGADGDMVDVFIGPDASSTTAYVARCQVAGKWGAYDEDKVMLGFPSEEAAREAFLQNYNDPRFLGGLDVMSIDKLKERLGKPGRLAKSILILSKAHVSAYTKKDGTFVPAHEDRRQAAREEAAKPSAKTSMPDTLTIDGVERPTKNSKGQSIHPTEEGIRNFWKWFGGDGLLDEDGRPMPVYHGGGAEFSGIQDKGRFGKAIFVKQGSESGYGDVQHALYLRGDVLSLGDLRRSLRGDEDNEILKAATQKDLSEDDADDLVRALTTDENYPSDEHVWDLIGAIDEADAQLEIQKLRGKVASMLGASAVETPDEFDGDTIMVVDPMAIKSATGNAGTFNPSTADITKSLLIFTKAHVGPYLRGGKLVNLSGYQGRPARARATAGQMGLFADLPPAEKPKRKKAGDMTRFDHETTGDLFADADEHGEVPPGRRLMPRSDTVTESRKELIAEHERLVQVLRSPSHEDDKKEAEKQAAELAEYKAGEASKPILLLTSERESANAQNSLTTASSSPKVEVSEPSDTARRESGAQEKKMSKPWYRSFKEWYDDADMPEKRADGTWVDLETGLQFVDPASFKAEKPIPEKKRADAGMKLDELRDRCARLVKGQAKALDRARANGLNPEAIAVAEAAVAEGLRLLQGKAKKADFQAHADLNAEASRKLNAAHSGPKNAPEEVPPKASDDVLAAVDAALSAVEPKPAKAEVDPADLVAPTGYTLTRENGEIVLRGPWSDDLHARLKRAGGKWEGSGHGTGRVGRKAWIIPEDKASSLKRIFANVGGALAAEEAGRKAAAQAEAEKAAAAKAEADRKQAEARAAAPIIAGGQYGPFTVRAVSGGYRVMFAYDSARVAQIKANGGKKYDPVEKSWFVDAADAGKLQSILERAKAAAAAAPSAPASSSASARKPRVLFPLSTMPAMGVPVTWRGRTVVFESKGEPFRINEDHPSLHGSHLLGYEGDRGAYAYYRDATPEEVQGMQADKNAPAEKSWGYSEDAVKRALEGRD